MPAAELTEATTHTLTAVYANNFTSFNIIIAFNSTITAHLNYVQISFYKHPNSSAVQYVTYAEVQSQINHFPTDMFIKRIAT